MPGSLEAGAVSDMQMRNGRLDWELAHFRAAQRGTWIVGCWTPDNAM